MAILDLEAAVATNPSLGIGLSDEGLGVGLSAPTFVGADASVDLPDLGGLLGGVTGAIGSEGGGLLGTVTGTVGSLLGSDDDGGLLGGLL